jgi:hypothetical protein
MNVGLGFPNISARVSNIDTSYSGWGISFGAAAGVAIVHNVIVFGSLAFESTGGSTLSLDGYRSDPHLDLNLYEYAAGFAYYFPWINLYLAAAVAGVNADLTPTDSMSSGQTTVPLTKSGPGFQLFVGKEWWVSANWGLGLAFELLQSWMVDSSDSSVRWHASSYSFLASGTYN